MAWESDLKSSKARGAFRTSRGLRPEQLVRRRSAPEAPKPSALTLPWLLFSYRSRVFMWTLILSTVIVGRLLYSHKTEFPLLPNYERANEVRCRKELLALRTGLEWFRAHCKRYPTDAEGLRALVRDPGVPGWNGYYIDQLPPDPWGHPYRYSCTNGTVRVWGTGADGLEGTRDDIASPDPDWRALMERIDIHSLPRPETNAASAEVTSRP